MSDEPLLTWKGRRVRSPGDGPESAARKVPSAPRPGSLFFIPSPLEGWGVDVLVDRLPPDAAVVLFELDPDLRDRCAPALATVLGPRAGDPRLFWLQADTEFEVRRLFQRLPLDRLRRCEYLTLNGAWMVQGPRYREVFGRLDNGLNRWWSNRITSLHMGPLWVRNLFDNLKSGATAWAPWPDWGTAPVLVCGAGTSLEGALPWVREHRDGLKVVAADTALPVLKAWDLIPDAVVCLEAQHANLRDFAGWRGAGPVLFTDLTSYPPSSRVFSSPTRWFITEFTELSIWGRWPWTDAQVPRLPPLGSVGVAASWVAWRLTQGPVILAGLDFSFPVGRTHARGAPALASLASRTTRFHPMEQPGTWLKPGLRQAPTTNWLTTPVMEGYAGVLADQARPHRQRTWVWDNQGLPLDLPVWSGDLPTKAPRLPTDSPDAPDQGPSPAQWLATEQELWRTILDDFVRINETPADEGAWADLETRLAMADYLTFSFPDPNFRRDTDWLVRAQVQVRWVLNRVSRPRRT